MDLDLEDEKIISITSHKSYSLEELCRELSISSEDCFSKVRRLESMGLLERVQDFVNLDENAVRPLSLYKAKQAQIRIPDFEG
jgi:DNA-binding MarR family transcriptional regulator